ncbi:hypothetical protein ACM39_00265 [Chryseobacterium sp. FH2]|uniref:hypothetical protein n=1 Tax=Chryseobacterium sp. FH2 TaxID=1674291 RepID=UPI00065B02BF|nr:hypothetical protein [Chryseobacterium sp. FH2]KMQ70002.1 hypothetical protein ACM39_00265 [Chryseobacterium sp. FH2]
MLHKAIIFSLGVLTLSNCSAQKEMNTSTKTSVTEIKETKSMNKEGEVIYFTEGENKFLKEAEMNLTFKGISEDSRCPTDVNCVWAGVAVANVEVMGLATRPAMLNLATTDNAGRNYFKTAEFNGYTISLVEVTPYPNSKEGVKALAGKYRIGITIKKAEEKSTMK